MPRSEEEYRALFESDPMHLDAFAGLRRMYRQGERHEDLAWLFETRADHMEQDAKATELYIRAADIRIQKLGDEEGGIEDLIKAMRCDPSQRRTIKKLKDLLKAAGRWSEYLEVLQNELESYSSSQGRERRVSALHLEIGTLLEERFTKVDKAMYHYQQAVRLDGRNVDALSAARRIYEKNGEWQMTARLLKAEIRITTVAKRRVELLNQLGQILAHRLHDLKGAAASLNEVVAADPGHTGALETLAEVYSSPDWDGHGGQSQAGRIFYQLARQRLSMNEQEEAVGLLKRAVTSDPANREASAALIDLYESLGQYEELDNFLLQGIQRADSAEKIELLIRRARLLAGPMGEREEAKLCYEQVLPYEQPGGIASAYLAELYMEDGEFEPLAELREKEIETIVDDEQRVEKMMELAVLYRDNLGDDDKAAVYLHAVLEIVPNHSAALEYYQEHFRKKEDWRGLADLLAFAADGIIHSRGDVSSGIIKLEELAEISERKLGDLQGAMDAWRQISEIQPDHPNASEQIMRLQRKARMWQSVLAALERDVQAAQSRSERVQALLRMAQAYWDKHMDPLRNIEILNEVLGYDPNNSTALKALTALYRRENDFEGYANVLKMRLEIVSDRNERVALLRQLAEVSSKELHNHRDAGWACTQILEAVPGDPDAIALLSKVLEEMEDWPKLVKTLRYYAKATMDDSEKLKILRNMAKVATEKMHDDLVAAEAWEKIMYIEPDDPDALSALTSLYEKLGKWAQLADVLEQRGKILADEDEKAFRQHMTRLAKVADTRLGDPDRALEAWRAVSEMMPNDREALGALTRLYYEQEDWEGVCEVLERQIPLMEDPEKAVGLTTRMAGILDEHLGRSKEAVELLEDVLEKSSQPNPDVMEQLRKSYVTIGEPAKAVKMAERQLEAVEEPEERLKLSLEIAAAWRDEVGDDEQAIAAYEGVMETHPDSREALSALVVLYTRTGRWDKLIETNKVLFDFADNDRDRLRLLYQIAEVYEERLDKPEDAFKWYRRAFELFPDDRGTLTSLERAAAEHGLWEPLIEVYEEMRARSAHPSNHLETAAKIARIREKEMKDPDTAFDVLRGALVVDLTGEEFLPELERLAEDRERWDDLVEIYERVLRHRKNIQDRVQLLHRTASILEDELDDKKAALGRIRRAFDLDPSDLVTQDRLLGLAEEGKSWDDLLAVYTVRYNRAPTLDEKLDLVKVSAAIVEEKAGDKLKAFRAYLHGFLIEPEDDEVLGHLWRLAKELGEYTQEMRERDLAQRQEHEEKIKSEAKRKLHREKKRKGDVSSVSPSALSAGPVFMEGEAMPIGVSERPDVTQELDLNDLELMDDEIDEEVESLRSMGHTGEISLSDVLEIEAVRTGETPAMDADSGFYLLEKIESSKVDTIPPSDKEPTGEHIAPAGEIANISQSYSAWEEFARAYAMLPAPDLETRRHYCHKIAEIWRDGARNLKRAFDALRWALEMDVTDEETRIEIEEVARAGDLLRSLVEVLEDISENTHGMDLFVLLNREIARFCEELEDFEKAEKHYKSILSIKPDFRIAFERLQEIYRNSERWQELAALEERRMEDLVDELPAGPEREAKLRELAVLYGQKLDQPYEAMEAWGKVLELQPDDIEAYKALAELGERTASWSRAVEALGHLEALLPDEEEVLEVRRRMAAIYRDELELPDRAIEIYTRILDLLPEDPETLASLDMLYERHESWEELDRILDIRARLVGHEHDWESLTLRRAKNLAENLDDPSGAADCYEALRAALPAKIEYGQESIRLLREGGRFEDSMSVYSELLEQARKREAPSGEIAALLVKQANMLSQAMGDANAARRCLEEALELVPDYPSALGELARLHRDEEDWPAYVEARMREAEAAVDETEKTAAFMEAATVYREKLKNAEKAKECYLKVLEVDSGFLDAVGGLASLAEEAGDAEEQIEYLKKQLEIVEDPSRKAEILTRTASAYLEGLGDSEQGEKYLQEALQADRDHVPAVIALADLYYKCERWEQAKNLMEAALQRLDGQPELAATLGYRLAGLYHDRGEDKDAYSFLRELDRRNPHQFLLKLAIGENRYNEKRWREAAKILAALAEHENASMYPEETARALCKAAEAETNQRRPGKAPPLWSRALEFKPDYLDAINALVKYHTDRGALDDAATYLQAQAEATADPETKVQLWDSLGDLYLEELEDDGGALTCYTEALEAAEPIEKNHLPILEKAFPLCRTIGDDEQAARIISFILAFTEDPELKSPRHVQAADAFVALGEMDKAEEHLVEAMRLDSYNEPAVTMLVDIQERKGEYRSAAEHLAQYLESLQEDVSDDAEWSRRAALYERLAELYRHGLEDPHAAIGVLEKGLELDPTRISSREKLSELYGANPEYEERAFYNHQALVADDVSRHESLKHLADIYMRREEVDRALCVARALEIQGRADLDLLGFIAQHSPPPLDADGRWPGTLSDEDRAQLIAHMDTRTMGEVFATVWEGAPALFGGGLERFGLSAKDRVSPVADMVLAKVYGASARALGNRLAGLYVSWTGDYTGVNIGCHAPPLIVAGPDVEEKPLGELRFLLGRALEYARPEYILAAGLEPSEFNSLFAAILRAFHPRHSRRKLDDSDPISRRAKNLKKDLPYRVSRKLVDLLQKKAHVEFNSASWRKAVKMTGNRAGLLVCGDLKSAVSVVLAEETGSEVGEDFPTDEAFDEILRESDVLRDLMSFAVSEEFFQARRRLGQKVVLDEAG